MPDDNVQKYDIVSFLLRNEASDLVVAVLEPEVASPTADEESSTTKQTTLALILAPPRTARISRRRERFTLALVGAR